MRLGFERADISNGEPRGTPLDPNDGRDRSELGDIYIAQRPPPARDPARPAEALARPAEPPARSETRARSGTRPGPKATADHEIYKRRLTRI